MSLEIISPAPVLRVKNPLAKEYQILEPSSILIPIKMTKKEIILSKLNI